MDIYCKGTFKKFIQSNSLEPERKQEWINTKSLNYRKMNYYFNTGTILKVLAYQWLV